MLKPSPRTCSQIALETAGIFYGCNTFHCSHYNHFDDDVEEFIALQWLDSLGKWRRSKLTTLSIQQHYPGLAGRDPTNRPKIPAPGSTEEAFQRCRRRMWRYLDRHGSGIKAGVVTVDPF